MFWDISTELVYIPWLKDGFSSNFALLLSINEFGFLINLKAIWKKIQEWFTFYCRYHDMW